LTFEVSPWGYGTTDTRVEEKGRDDLEKWVRERTNRSSLEGSWKRWNGRRGERKADGRCSVRGHVDKSCEENKKWREWLGWWVKGKKEGM